MEQPVLLQKETNPSLNTVTGYGDNYLEINREKYQSAVYFGPNGPINILEINTIDEINLDLLHDLIGIKSNQDDPMAFLDDEPEISLPEDAPEVILVGTGDKQVFLPGHITQPLLSMGIGIESMTTHAAARTYNILMSEERRVIVILLPGEHH